MNNNENGRIFFCNVKDLKRKHSVKEWCKQRLNDAVGFWNNNKEFVILVGIPTVTAVAGIGKTIITSATRSTARRRVDRSKSRKFYDPSLHSWWDLKHPLTNSQRSMIDKRRRNGERLSDILDDMRLI